MERFSALLTFASLPFALLGFDSVLTDTGLAGTVELAVDELDATDVPAVVIGLR